jgi:hypothetical protein
MQGFAISRIVVAQAFGEEGNKRELIITVSFLADRQIHAKEGVFSKSSGVRPTARSPTTLKVPRIDPMPIHSMYALYEFYISIAKDL